jgi:hypothetical protein
MATNDLGTSEKNGPLFGLLSCLLAIAAAGSVAMIGFTSFTAFNPPDWLRIATMAPLPLLLILSVGLGIVSLKRGASRFGAIAGLVLAGLSLIAFITMVSFGG